MDITSRKNEKVLHLRKLGTSPEYRRERGEFLCDGAKLLAEAAAHGAEIRDVFVCGDVPPGIPEGARVYEVPREVLEAASPLKTPQDVLFSAALPKAEQGPVPAGSVILENVQDPGNVGTMLRSANAFGAPAVVLTGACADPWGPKAVRASMGAVFRERIVETDLAGLGAMKRGGVRLLGAALGARSEDIRKADLSGAFIAIGNEGAGLSRELLALCDGLVIIPMDPGCESLNAASAAAVILWEMARRRNG